MSYNTIGNKPWSDAEHRRQHAKHMERTMGKKDAAPKVMTSRSKKQPSRLGTATGGTVSKYEHRLLWDVVRLTDKAIGEAALGHNGGWQGVQDAIDKLQDEFSDPEEI